jgi:hypothetical protein
VRLRSRKVRVDGRLAKQCGPTLRIANLSSDIQN